jgi:hypothetical protein
MTPKEYTIAPHVSGDSWNGIDLITISINSAPPDEELVSAKIQFRKSSMGSVFLTLDSADGSVVIEDAALWQMSVPSQIVSLSPDDYYWDLQTTDASGSIKTYVKGTWTILGDITR